MDPPSVCDKIEVYWDMVDQYYPGVIGNYDNVSDKFQTDYTDGEFETQDLGNGQWKCTTDDYLQLFATNVQLRRVLIFLEQKENPCRATAINSAQSGFCPTKPKACPNL